MKFFRIVFNILHPVMFFVGLSILLRPLFVDSCTAVDSLLRNSIQGAALMLCGLYLKLNALEFVTKIRVRAESDSKPPDKGT